MGDILLYNILTKKNQFFFISAEIVFTMLKKTVNFFSYFSNFSCPFCHLKLNGVQIFQILGFFSLSFGWCLFFYHNLSHTRCNAIKVTLSSVAVKCCNLKIYRFISFDNNDTKRSMVGLEMREKRRKSERAGE